VLICAVATAAAAQPQHNRGWGWGNRDHHHQRYDRDRDKSGAFWGGVLGGWIAQALRPGREGEDVEGDLRPWTDPWFEWCKRRYRTFDPQSGQYWGYDGKPHFCG
jgi:hypothetical protein